jgi:hypothetical protein
MRGEIKESRLAYKSEWLEVYEDLLSIDVQPDKRGKKDNLHQQHHKNTNDVKLFNKIKLKSDSATILPVFSDGSLLMIEIYRRGIDKFLLDLPSGLIENNEKPHETAKESYYRRQDIVAGRLSIWDGFIHGPQNLIKNHIYF